jgi:polyisoprenoid-binding protein YceI
LARSVLKAEGRRYSTMANWTFDPTHSGIHFSVRHLMISKVRGSFNKWTGTFEYDEKDPSKSKISVSIDVNSIDTKEAQRDGHLKSPDFFEAEKFPEITFKSTSIAKDGDDFKLAGDLTIHGVTKPVELKVESHGQGKDPWGNERAGFSVKATISRKEFGLQWNQALETGGVVVGDKVEIEADIEAIKPAVKAA